MTEVGSVITAGITDLEWGARGGVLGFGQATGTVVTGSITNAAEYGPVLTLSDVPLDGGAILFEAAYTQFAHVQAGTAGTWHLRVFTGSSWASRSQVANAEMPRNFGDAVNSVLPARVHTRSVPSAGTTNVYLGLVNGTGGSSDFRMFASSASPIWLKVSRCP